MDDSFSEQHRTIALQHSLYITALMPLVCMYAGGETRRTFPRKPEQARERQEGFATETSSVGRAMRCSGEESLARKGS